MSTGRGGTARREEGEQRRERGERGERGSEGIAAAERACACRSCWSSSIVRTLYGSERSARAALSALRMSASAVAVAASSHAHATACWSFDQPLASTETRADTCQPRMIR